MTSIVTTRQQTSPGPLVTLFELDCTVFAPGTILRFTSTAYNTAPVIWNGNTYTPVDIVATGFDYTGKGAFPTPTMKITNVNFIATAMVIAYNDLLGATVRRIRTFAQYLDGGSTPDPLQTLPIDVFTVEQKTAQTSTYIEWKLSAAVDQQGIQIPSFQMVRDYCARTYRVYDPTQSPAPFDYSRATCPYAGTNSNGSPYVDITNTVTANPALDACSKTIIGCKAHFGANAQLPFKAFPGLGRTQ